MTTAALPVPAHGPDSAEVGRARYLARIGLAWHVGEAAVAIGAGIAAASPALIAFGADSLIEMLAGLVLLWRLADGRAASEAAELRAQRLIALTFLLVAGYVGFEAVTALAGAQAPDVSWVGIGLAAVTVVVMPPLARAKRRAAGALHSSATASEAAQTEICAYLGAALLFGLGTNALLGWWWADPAVALVIAAVCLREAREAWRGEACCTGGCR